MGVLGGPYLGHPSRDGEKHLSQVLCCYTRKGFGVFLRLPHHLSVVEDWCHGAVATLWLPVPLYLPRFKARGPWSNWQIDKREDEFWFCTYPKEFIKNAVQNEAYQTVLGWTEERASWAFECQVLTQELLWVKEGPSRLQQTVGVVLDCSSPPPPESSVTVEISTAIAALKMPLQEGNSYSSFRK